jgi:hypothetical protein
MASVRTAVISTEKRRPRMAWCRSYAFLLLTYIPAMMATGTTTATTCVSIDERKAQSSVLSRSYR